MPSLVTKRTKRARRMLCKGARTRALSYGKTRAKRMNRHRINQATREAKFMPDFDIEPIKRSEMFTEWEVI